MKKVFLSVFLVTATLFSASAQLFPSFQLGVKGGASFANIKDISIKSTSRSGYLVGVWARVGGAGVHLQPELYLTSKKAELGEDGKTDRINFTAMDLPILLGTRVGVGPIAARIQVGPVVTFVIDKDDSFIDNLGQATDFKDYKKQSFSLTGGLGLDIMNVRADVRYQHGLTDVFKNEDNDNKGRMNVWTVSVGYRLL